METIDKFLKERPYSWKANKKKAIYLDFIGKLNKHHYKNCETYKNILDSLSFSFKKEKSIQNFPYLPVNLFKTNSFLSVPREEIIKTMSSSGTSGAGVSMIYLNRYNASLQTKVLNKIVSNFIGTIRLPMLVVDSEANFKSKKSFSAKSAAIRGFSVFAKKVYFLLDKDLKINISVLNQFCKAHNKEKVIVFGFTYSIYKDFLCALKNLKKKVNLPYGILIHGGGWKKMQDKKISNISFKDLTTKSTGIKKIHNYYGLIEQTGSIYMECEKGFYHTSNFSDILLRKTLNSLAGIGEKGLVQLISPLPVSYPGHNILTQDIGEIFGEDDCACGRKGKYFMIYGRTEEAEIRGCSDA
jgi:phenylacetate-coenzyme A ligase PaaK-like adenylate-forming protein